MIAFVKTHAVLWAKALGVALLAIVAPAHTLIVAVITLAIADAVTGVWAARKRGERISSAGLRRTPVKLAVYLAGILLGALIDATMGEPWVSRLIASSWAVVEGRSIAENLDTITGTDLFAALLARLGSRSGKDQT